MDGQRKCRKISKPILDVIVPCYELQHVVDWQLDWWGTYSFELLQKLRLILIDDGTEPPLKINPDFELNLLYLRTLEDIPWNHTFCRNLAFNHSQTKWCINTDVDHMFTPQNMGRLLAFLPLAEKNTVYYFHRRLEDGTKYRFHINTYLIEAQAYKDAGWSDEDFCGAYGHPDRFMKRVYEKKLNVVERHKNVYVTTIGDKEENKVKNFSRNVERNRKLLREKTRLLNMRAYKNGPILRSKWERVKELEIS